MFTNGLLIFAELFCILCMGCYMLFFRKAGKYCLRKKREKLLSQKEELKELKSRQEIFHDLFDTEFYLEHKDDRLKTLLYKR